MVLWVSLLCACLVSKDLYQDRKALLTDDDGDGWIEEDGDCDDGDRTIHPQADELCNGVDDDCDTIVDNDPSDGTTWYPDADGDGFGDPALATRSCEAPQGYADQADDCDDGNGAVHPGVDEVCDNGLDDDCDGAAPGCGLTGEHVTRVASESTVSVPFAVAFDLGAADQHARVVDSETGGQVVLLGLPRDTLAVGAGGAGALVLVAPRDAATPFELRPSIVPPADGSMTKLGASVVPVPSIDSLGFSGAAATATLQGSGGVALGTVVVVYGRLPDAVNSAPLPDATITLAGAGAVTDSADVNGDHLADLVGWSEADAAVAVWTGPLVSLGEHSTPAMLLTGGSLALGSDELVWGGYVMPDWDGSGQAAIVGAAYASDADKGAGGASSRLYLSPYQEGASLAVLDAPVLRTSEGPELNLGVSEGPWDLQHDVDGDGYPDLVIPSAYDGREHSFGGSVAVILGPMAEGEETWAPDYELQGTSEYQLVGASAAVGDFDGDGQAEVAVGWLDDSLAGSAGAVGIWHPEPGTATIDELSDVARGDLAGQVAALARAADLNSDSYDDLVILAPGSSSESIDGAIYLLYGGGL